MKRVAYQIPAIAIVLALLPQWAIGQSMDYANSLFIDAYRLIDKKPRTRENFEKAAQKLERALQIYDDRHFSDGQTSNAATELGYVYGELGNYKKALQYYSRSLELSTKFNDRRGQANTLKKMAWVCSRRGEKKQALEYYRKCLEFIQLMGDRRQEAGVLVGIGSTYMGLGQYDKAAEFLGRSLEVWKSLGDSENEAQTLSAIAELHFRRGDIDKAFDLYKKTLEIGKATLNRQLEGSSLYGIAGVYQQRGQYKQAMESCEKSLHIAKQIGDSKVEAWTLSRIGQIHTARGDYSKALDCQKRCLEISCRMNDLDGESRFLNDLAGTYYQSGQYRDALQSYEKALKINQQIGDKQRTGSLYNNMAVVYVSWGRHQRALELFTKSLDIIREIRDRSAEATTLHNMACVYASWGEREQALELLGRAMEICKEIKYLDLQATIQKSVAGLQIQNGDYEKALEHLKVALRIWSEAESLSDSRKEVIGHMFLDIGDVPSAESLIVPGKSNSLSGRLSLLKKEFSSAKRSFERLLASGEKNKSLNDLFAGYTGLGLAFEALQEDSKAVECFEKSIALIEEFRTDIGPEQRTNFFDVGNQGFARTVPYKGLARVLVKQNQPLEALKNSEHTKARAFSEMLSRRSEGSQFSVPETVLSRGDQLRDQLGALKQHLRIAEAKENKSTIASLRPQVTELEHEFKTYLQDLHSNYPLFAATKYPELVDPVHIAVEDSDWVLAYDVTDLGVIIYLSRGKQVVKAVIKPIERNALDEMIQKFLEPLQSVKKSNLVEKLESFSLSVGQRLSEVLLEDMLSELPDGVPVIIVPDGSLGMLPFEMLVIKNGGKVGNRNGIPCVTGTEFFGDRNPISYYQSITALALARTLGRRKVTTDRLLVIADPVFDVNDQRAQASVTGSTNLTSFEAKLYQDLMIAVEEGKIGGLSFNRLSLTGDLADKLALLYKGKADIYTGLDASKDMFLKRMAPQLEQYKEIVFATHGYFGKNLPGIMEPVLVLTTVPSGTDGYLRMSEVMSLDMSA
ncbi:MAG: tetratricopeptide repeat protein, partial [Desulfomonilaceae bacterium]